MFGDILGRYLMFLYNMGVALITVADGYQGRLSQYILYLL